MQVQRTRRKEKLARSKGCEGMKRVVDGGLLFGLAGLECDRSRAKAEGAQKQRPADQALQYACAVATGMLCPTE